MSAAKIRGNNDSFCKTGKDVWSQVTENYKAIKKMCIYKNIIWIY